VSGAFHHEERKPNQSDNTDLEISMEENYNTRQKMKQIETVFSYLWSYYLVMNMMCIEDEISIMLPMQVGPTCFKNQTR